MAFGTIAIGIGGSMTYGQTIGLTQKAPVIGNWDAWRWGMLGLGIKGATWIVFAGLFLGMGLGGARYTSRQILLLMLGMIVLYSIGWWALNCPRTIPQTKFCHGFIFRPRGIGNPTPEPNLNPGRKSGVGSFSHCLARGSGPAGFGETGFPGILRFGACWEESGFRVRSGAFPAGA